MNYVQGSNRLQITVSSLEDQMARLNPLDVGLKTNIETVQDAVANRIYLVPTGSLACGVPPEGGTVKPAGR